MSDCCDIHSGVKPATHRVLLYEPGREPRRYDVCYECGEAMYTHNAAKLRQTGRPDKVRELERTVANPDTIVRSRRIHHDPDRRAEAGIGGRSANEASRRSQIRAAAEAGKQAELEKAVERVAARQHQAAPGPGNESSATEVPDPDLGQGPLTHEDPVLDKDATDVITQAASGWIAAAARRHVPYTELPDQIIDAAGRSGFDQYPFSRTNLEVGLRMAKEDAKERFQEAGKTLHVAEAKERVERFRNRTEDARYPAQRDEQGSGR